MAARLFTLTGPSASGKSSVVEILQRLRSSVFEPVIVSKCTTRQPREDDGAEIICVEKIPPECDLVYEQYGVRYGFRLRELFEILGRGCSPIVIVNDIRTVEDLRVFLGPAVTSIYIFRESPSLEKYLSVARERNVGNEDEYRTRFRKAQAIHRVYIENIQNFDFVILNVGGWSFLERQIRGILGSLFVAGESLKGKGEDSQ